MSAEHVEIRTEDGVADGYLARPADDDGRLPGVLLHVDAFGLRPQIEGMAELNQSNIEEENHPLHITTKAA